MSELLEVFKVRDGMTEAEALFEIEDMKGRVLEGENPEDVLYEYGLEPDYVLDLLESI